ncbi:MarR family winged helix-turn-helix transcriptional regulator [Kribbella sp. CA-293567]|uniref:MarR family winged helix-turn-helix transcriptional regulator n=1 Tax=Kribbella sp. CA-293567 TaxID=3002436 RepID=UPI0022DDF7C4|nr:helix-turn-helix domain-containing protein [Kribbella sp. CA-293567]WBQ02140.1 helix-turn-helix domain-containing protein [Kribbella sp. CA-293567]
MNRDQELLAAAALTAFKLNGQFLELAEHLARPAGVTVAWWQVLGAVLGEPLPVPAIAREMGITRQAVQRTADVLAERGLAEYRDNPAHRRAKLVAITSEGRAAIRGISPHHARHAAELVSVLGADQLTEAVAALTKLSGALDALDLSD